MLKKRSKKKVEQLLNSKKQTKKGARNRSFNLFTNYSILEIMPYTVVVTSA